MSQEVEAKENADFPNIELLVEKLTNGVAHFVFEKGDGTVRHAFGTTNGEIVPILTRTSQESLQGAIDCGVQGDMPQAVALFAKHVMQKVEAAKKPKREYTRSDETISYFDIEKQAWRSCRVDAILTVFG